MLSHMNSTQLKGQPGSGFEIPTAGKTDNLGESCGAPKLSWETVLRMRVKIGTKIMRSHFPISCARSGNYMFGRDFAALLV